MGRPGLPVSSLGIRIQIPVFGSHPIWFAAEHCMREYRDRLLDYTVSNVLHQKHKRLLDRESWIRLCYQESLTGTTVASRYDGGDERTPSFLRGLGLNKEPRRGTLTVENFSVSVEYRSIDYSDELEIHQRLY